LFETEGSAIFMILPFSPLFFLPFGKLLTIGVDAFNKPAFLLGRIEFGC